jgi:MarR family transcriptional regulator for hemolysin
MAPPAEEPVGLAVTRSAKALSRAFDDALAAAGGSLPVWLVLVSLKSQDHAAQRRLAESVGIEGPTLTHHLDRMEEAGLVTRRRDPTNRRAQLVTLTDEGEAAFTRLLAVVVDFDRCLRAGVSERDVATLRRVLEHLVSNARPTGTEEVPT